RTNRTPGGPAPLCRLRSAPAWVTTAVQEVAPLTDRRGIAGPAGMLAKLNTFALVGIEAIPVEAEVDASAGLPKTVLVGLPELAVKESIHRIERALANLGYQRHPGRLVINLAPADIRKEAAAYDLPIALGLLVATGQLLPEQLRDVAVVGELALDGSV